MRWLVDAAIVVAAFFAIQWWLTRDVVRGALPALDAPMVNGSAFEQWRAAHGGDGFVLYVWATWCPICKTIEGSVDAVAQDAPLVTVAICAWSRPSGLAVSETANDTPLPIMLPASPLCPPLSP